MLKLAPRNTGRRVLPALAAAIATLVLAVSAPVPALAAPPPLPPRPQAAVGAGICAVAGTMSETFSPRVGAVPANVTVSVTGTGTCVGNSGVTTTITLNLGGVALLSCAGGEGSVAGNVSFSNGFPPLSTVTAQYIGGAESEQLDILGTGFVAIADLAWAPPPSATCPASGTASTALFGSLVYVYE